MKLANKYGIEFKRVNQEEFSIFCIDKNNNKMELYFEDSVETHYIAYAE